MDLHTVAEWLHRLYEVGKEWAMIGAAGGGQIAWWALGFPDFTDVDGSLELEPLEAIGPLVLCGGFVGAGLAALFRRDGSDS